MTRASALWGSSSFFYRGYKVGLSRKRKREETPLSLRRGVGGEALSPYTKYS